MELKRYGMASLVLALLTACSFAQSGSQGGGNGGCTQLAGCLQDCRQANSLLSEDEIAAVIYIRQEEKIARDAYITFSQVYEVVEPGVFTKIAISEQLHMDAVYKTIDQHADQIEDPITDDTVGAFDDEGFATLYQELVYESGALDDYIEALKIGCYIEEMDILDLIDWLEVTEKASLTKLFEELMRGSRNHLRAFVRNLAAEGVTYEPVLLTQEQYEGIITGPMEPGPGKGRCRRGGCLNGR